jgi:hypothetical protein
MIRWLLRDHPALLGDVLEERASGRSKAWYWRQILVAVVRSVFSEARRHPVLTLRTVATALAAYFVVSVIGFLAYGFLYGYLFPVTWDPASRWLMIPMEVAASALAGWIVARAHRACIEAAIVVLISLGLVVGSLMDVWTLLANIVGLVAGVFIGARPRSSAAMDALK